VLYLIFEGVPRVTTTTSHSGFAQPRSPVNFEFYHLHYQFSVRYLLKTQLGSPPPLLFPNCCPNSCPHLASAHIISELSNHAHRVLAALRPNQSRGRAFAFSPDFTVSSLPITLSSLYEDCASTLKASNRLCTAPSSEALPRQYGRQLCKPAGP
jgi:hypothetical protein